MTAVQRVLILRGDRLSAEALQNAVLAVLPQALVKLASSARVARGVLAGSGADFFLTGLDPSCEGDVLGLLDSLPRGSPPRVMVIVGHEETRLWAALPAMGLHAVFDSANDSPEAFPTALRVFISGGRTWSTSVWTRICAYRNLPDSTVSSLTAMERFVLSVVGDGTDDNSAAELLALRPTTIATIRRNLHRKLGVQHRGDLVRFAAQHGFVRFTPHGVVRPGITILADACRSPTASRSPFVGDSWPTRASGSSPAA